MRSRSSDHTQTEVAPERALAIALAVARPLTCTAVGPFPTTSTNPNQLRLIATDRYGLKSAERSQDIHVVAFPSCPE